MAQALFPCAIVWIPRKSDFIEPLTTFARKQIRSHPLIYDPQTEPQAILLMTDGGKSLLEMSFGALRFYGLRRPSRGGS